MTTALLDRLAPPVDDATRREFLIGGLSLAALIAGCGAPDADPPTPAGSDNGRFPVTIEHKYGSTEITDEPKRVVTVGVTDQDPVLALGVTPVAMVNWRGSPFFPWNVDLVGALHPAELSDTSESINVEEVAAQGPDLIFALWSNLSKREYQLLSQIAPVVAPDGDYPAFGTPWQVTTRVAGKALGRSEQADQLIADVETQIADIKAQHPDLEGKNVTIAADFGDGQLNVTDVVLWIVLPDANIQQNPLYLAQPVHQLGRDIFLDTNTGLALTFGSVLSIPYAAKRLAAQLTAAADSDPTTEVTP